MKSKLQEAVNAMPKSPHPYEHLTDVGLLKELDSLAEKSTQCDDVSIGVYHYAKEGYTAYQFEGVRGGIQQEPDDYEFYAALRTAWPRLRKTLDAYPRLVNELNRLCSDIPKQFGSNTVMGNALLRELGEEK